MKASMRLLGALTLPVLMSLCSQALAGDPAQLPVLVDAKVIDQRSSDEIERSFPLGAVRKISGQLRMDGQVTARGRSQTTTYELPAEHTAAQAFDAVREAWQDDGAQILFWCQARDCGESSLWANEVLGNARLYGADDQQAFMLLRRDDKLLMAVYSITGGNRKGYISLDTFTASQPLGVLLPTSATVLRELRSTGELDYPDLTAAPQADWVQLLARSLNQDYTVRVSLSGKMAEDWRQALIDGGVRAARLETVESQEPGLHLELIR